MTPAALPSYEAIDIQTDWDIVRGNYDLVREVEACRGQLERQSGRCFGAKEWDIILPATVTSIIQHAPRGENFRLDFSGLRIGLGPYKRKEIRIQRSSDGLSSTATITETGN